MNYPSIIEQVKLHAQGCLNEPGHQQLSYHNLAHTTAVVEAVMQIANHYQMGEQDRFILMAAAWFHDLGYFSADPSNHEIGSAALAGDFLTGLGVDQETIDKIRACILATRMPQKPANLLEEILCDADLFHLGTAEFSERNKLMRKEFELVSGGTVSKEVWRNNSIQLLRSHQYHTDYCRLLLDKNKQENLAKLEQKQQEDFQKQTIAPVVLMEGEITEGKKQKTKEKDGRPDKGIETMFRVASTNQQRLSDMSDNKAHIMISVNSIIISVIIGLVVRRLDSSPNIILPTLILLTGSLVAVIFAVLATRPKIPGGRFTKEQVTDKSANLLFFGNFYKMNFKDYYEGMQQVMTDREFLYGMLIKDIYSQGKVLGRKYKLLRISYTIFMFTLILSIFAFAIATIFF